MSLTDEQLDRYARHIVLKEIGGAGQAKLVAAHVVVIGAGGIGAPALLYLAAAGVGRLTIIDDDVVSLSNLQRQVIYGTADLGQSKAALAAQRVTATNPDVEAVAIAQRIGGANATALLDGASVVLDGSDNFATRPDRRRRHLRPAYSARLGSDRAVPRPARHVVRLASRTTLLPMLCRRRARRRRLRHLRRTRRARRNDRDHGQLCRARSNPRDLRLRRKRAWQAAHHRRPRPVDADDPHAQGSRVPHLRIRQLTPWAWPFS